MSSSTPTPVAAHSPWRQEIGTYIGLIVVLIQCRSVMLNLDCNVPTIPELIKVQR